jgi:hypothetical protein
VEDQNHTLEILVFVECVLENTREIDWLCDLEKLVGNLSLVLILFVTIY